ncbi:HlyD family secretion protein [Bosea sp. CRIB-10]|uniref:HlyD family secretion protein n=1 Tax=Bosea sp. CRIB-10 TaxID=378404 RepID=UPI0015873941|nr:HlyD family secretion protein [Bosea sp. CRIB-10]
MATMKLLSAGLGSLLVAGTVFGAVSGAVAPRGWLSALQSTTTDNAYVRGDVTPISPRIAGYITEVSIRDNQAIKAGDVLFRIDDSDYRARVDQAAAALDTRRALLANLASRIDQAHAVLKGAEAEDDRAARDFVRIRELRRQGWAPQARSEQTEADHLRAAAKLAEAQANVTSARRQMEVLDSQRPQLTADIAGAQAALRLAEIELEHTTVRGPADGWVSERQARVGQYVRPGTLLIAVVPRAFWVVANFKETQLPAFHLGGAVAITIDAAPGAVFRGRVESFSPASGAQFALLPPDNATGNFTKVVQRIPVRIAFDAGQPELERLRPGMSAIVTLLSARHGADQ